MPDYCPYAYLIPWTTEGHAYAKKEQRLWLDSVVAIADRALEATKEEA